MPLTRSQATFLLTLLVIFTTPAMAASGELGPVLQDFTTSTIGMIAIGVFVLAYLFVISEEFIHLRKSKPVIVAAGIIWVLVAIAYKSTGDTVTPAFQLRHNILDFAELMLFLWAAMTYINTMEERNVFHAIRAWLVSSDFTLRTVFWITGGLAFIISPVADNLTTALVMAAVVMTVGGDNIKFVSIACINIVVAANAGGAFSPFGDITTLMVWQKGIIDFFGFFALLIPSIINWLIPAFIMSFTVSKDKPAPLNETVNIKHGGLIVVVMFLLTITLTVSLHNVFHLPPALGMMTGMGLLQIFGYYLKKHDKKNSPAMPEISPGLSEDDLARYFKPKTRPFDIFISIKRVEWDTLLFFYGVILCVGGLATLGYLSSLSIAMYDGLGATTTNILVGLVSAIVDNIPVMFAVLTMNPDMSTGQWLLVTLTAGVGGSLLSVGSAAGVALMGQARGVYTFFGHLKWTWAIALGYAASIGAHLMINADLMQRPLGG
ncbi:sodium:proton antiporter NhaD [Gammaproteobacteria bacterium AH-315-M22]|nr:sodium:proton antiporter NhaD [Gammaproteobacteria bacterium AH-315-M22]